MFLGPLGAILRLRKQKRFEKTRINTEFGYNPCFFKTFLFPKL